MIDSKNNLKTFLAINHLRQLTKVLMTGNLGTVEKDMPSNRDLPYFCRLKNGGRSSVG